jgi:hypothetical protein
VGPEQGVDSRPVGSVDRAEDLISSLDDEIGVGQIGRDIGGGVQHGRILRPAGSVRDVAGIVGDDEQRAARGQRCCGVGDRCAPGGCVDLQVAQQREVDGLRCVVGRGVGDGPGDRRAVALAGPGLLECHGGEVDADHLPPERSQPDRVASLAAREVERPPGCKVGQLLLDEPVRRGAPHAVEAAVALVPGGGVH